MSALVHLSAAMLCVAAPIAAAQEPKAIYYDKKPFSSYGVHMEPAGDVNGDGVEDLLAEYVQIGGVPGCPIRVEVLSGGDGTLILRGFDVAGEAQYHHGFPLGDVNGDGAADIAIVPYHPITGPLGSILVASGSDSSVLYEVTLEYGSGHVSPRVVGIGDVNGDALADYVVAEPGSYSKPLVPLLTVRSGADGSVLVETGSGVEGGLLGFRLESAGDVNADGAGDFIAAPPLELAGSTACPSGFNPEQTVYVYSGKDGKVLRRFSHEFSAGGYFAVAFGRSVESAGDVDADGYVDQLISGPGDENPTGSAISMVRVIAGRTGEDLYQLKSGQTFDRYGWTAIGPGDVTQDGHDDIAVADLPAHATGTIRLHSGTDGSSVAEVAYNPICPTFFDAVIEPIAATGDWNNDGVPDLAVGELGGGILRVYDFNYDADPHDPPMTSKPFVPEPMMTGFTPGDAILTSVSSTDTDEATFPGIAGSKLQVVGVIGEKIRVSVLDAQQHEIASWKIKAGSKKKLKLPYSGIYTLRTSSLGNKSAYSKLQTNVKLGKAGKTHVESIQAPKSGEPIAIDIGLLGGSRLELDLTGDGVGGSTASLRMLDPYGDECPLQGLVTSHGESLCLTEFLSWDPGNYRILVEGVPPGEKVTVALTIDQEVGTADTVKID